MIKQKNELNLDTIESQAIEDLKAEECVLYQMDTASKRIRAIHEAEVYCGPGFLTLIEKAIKP